MPDIEEITHTIEHLQRAFTDLAMRGLRSSGAGQLASLESLREEFERIGAAHLAGRIAEVITAIRNDDRGAAAALLRAQASLGVLERVLTLETSVAALEKLCATNSSEDRDTEASDDES